MWSGDRLGVVVPCITPVVPHRHNSIRKVSPFFGFFFALQIYPAFL